MKGPAHTPLRIALLACALALGAGCAMPVGELAERPWTEVVTPHFHLLSEASAPETQRLAEQLARFRQLLIALEIMGETEPRVPLKIIVVSDKYAHDWLTNREFISVQHGVTKVPLRIITVSNWNTSNFYLRTNRPLIAGWYIDGLRGGYGVAGTNVAYRNREVARGMLFNVFAHFALVHGADSRRPPWFEDGFAEYLSGFEVDDAGGVTLGIQHEHRIKELKALEHDEWSLFFEALEEAAATIYPSYFQPLSWITTHYLLSTPERPAQLREYLRLYEKEGDLHDAYYQAFEVPWGDLRKEVHAYYRRGEYQTRYLGPEGMGPATSLESRPVAPSDLLFHLGDLAANGSRRLFSFDPTTRYLEGDMSAARLFQQSLERDPRNGLSLAGLAAVRLRAGDLKEADALLRRAEAIAPDAESVHTTRGNLLLARAHQSGGDADAERAEQLEAARASYRRAIELRPGVPEPHFRMAQSYLLDDPASEAALEWLQAALDLSPREPQVMLELAAVKLARGDTRDVLWLLDKVLDIEGDRALRDRARHLEREFWRLQRDV
jgi:tetratricopeptide (TPR) repeat protein